MEVVRLDSKKSVYELCSADPVIADILDEIGFKDIKKPGMLPTAGRFMTIPKAAKLKGFNLEDIRQVFLQHGYDLE
jgi:hypothetical protein